MQTDAEFYFAIIKHDTGSVFIVTNWFPGIAYH